MSHHVKGAVMVGLVLMGVMAVIPPTLLGVQPDPKSFVAFGNRWLTVIYNYQTLIAGVGAIGAALLTVGQMRESERQQDLRYRRQLYRESRRELIGARRLVDRLVPIMQDVGMDLWRLRTRLADDMKIYKADPNAVIYGWTKDEKAYYFFALSGAKKLHQMLETLETNEMELMASEVETELNALKILVRQAAQGAVDLPMTLADALYNSDRAPMKYGREIAFVLQMLDEAIKRTAPALETWYAQLRSDFGL